MSATPLVEPHSQRTVDVARQTIDVPGVVSKASVSSTAAPAKRESTSTPGSCGS